MCTFAPISFCISWIVTAMMKSTAVIHSHIYRFIEAKRYHKHHSSSTYSQINTQCKWQDLDSAIKNKKKNLCLHMCVCVSPLLFKTAVHPFFFTLGKSIAVDPRKCSVECEVVWMSGFLTLPKRTFMLLFHNSVFSMTSSAGLRHQGVLMPHGLCV